MVDLISNCAQDASLRTLFVLNMEEAFKSQWLLDFPYLSGPILGPTQHPVLLVPGLFPGGVKQPGHGVEHPSTSIPKVKERVDLYLYLPSGPPWPVLGLMVPYMETIFSSKKLVNFDCTAWQHVQKTVFIWVTTMRILNIARQRSPSLAK